jgi:hypothetical protein
MQEDEKLHEPQEKTPSLALKVGQVAVGVALAPVVAVVAGGFAVAAAVDIAFDGLETVVDKVTDGVTGVAERTGDKVKEFIEAKMEDSGVNADPSTVKLAKGAGKVAYGLARGGFAVSGALGHGLVGLMRKNHVSSGIIAKYLQHGFEEAGRNIREGAETFNEGLDERRKK